MLRRERAEASHAGDEDSAALEVGNHFRHPATHVVHAGALASVLEGDLAGGLLAARAFRFDPEAAEALVEGIEVGEADGLAGAAGLDGRVRGTADRVQEQADAGEDGLFAGGVGGQERAAGHARRQYGNLLLGPMGTQTSRRPQRAQVRVVGARGLV
jgi:hypothetical protein